VVGTGSTLFHDEISEGRPADVALDIDGLNVEAIYLWWSEFKTKKLEYGLAGKNCSWAVVEALKAGGSDQLFPWHKIATKKNIPLENLMMTLTTVLLREATFGDIFAVQSAGVRMLQRIIRSNKAGYGKSLKSVALAAGDAFSNVWSPQDALAYCLIVQENAGRSRAGKAFWQPSDPR
jgi:hypothetical protein